jgi:hypothetical protein
LLGFGGSGNVHMLSNGNDADNLSDMSNENDYLANDLNSNYDEHSITTRTLSSDNINSSTPTSPNKKQDGAFQFVSAAIAAAQSTTPNLNSNIFATPSATANVNTPYNILLNNHSSASSNNYASTNSNNSNGGGVLTPSKMNGTNGFSYNSTNSGLNSNANNAALNQPTNSSMHNFSRGSHYSNYHHSNAQPTNGGYSFSNSNSNNREHGPTAVVDEKSNMHSQTLAKTAQATSSIGSTNNGTNGNNNQNNIITNASADYDYEDRISNYNFYSNIINNLSTNNSLASLASLANNGQVSETHQKTNALDSVSPSGTSKSAAKFSSINELLNKSNVATTAIAASTIGTSNFNQTNKAMIHLNTTTKEREPNGLEKEKGNLSSSDNNLDMEDTKILTNKPLNSPVADSKMSIRRSFKKPAKFIEWCSTQLSMGEIFFLYTISANEYLDVYIYIKIYIMINRR